MKCQTCNKGFRDGVGLFRQNAKGEAGVWACAEHRKAPVDAEVQEIVTLVEKANENNS